jgi:hypothetical protein
MCLMICVYDSSVDYFWEELNVLDDLCIWWFYCLLRNYQHYYHIQKSSRTFNAFLKLSTKLSYTQIVKNIQLFSCFWRFAHTIDISRVSDKSWMFLTICLYDGSIDNIREQLKVLDDLCIWNSSLKLSTELSYTQIVKNIQLFSENINRTII